MLDLGGKRRADAAAVGRVRLWAEAGLGVDDTAVVMVTELACHEPGCCPPPAAARPNPAASSPADSPSGDQP
jgi:hypothetical protein